MIKLEIIKHQMKKIGISESYLSKLTKVGQSTINGVMNGERVLEKLQVKNYESIVNALFTLTERTLAEKSEWGVEQYEAYYKQALIQAVNSDDVKIYLSGGVSYNENNEPQDISAHVKVQWGFVDDKAIGKTTRVLDSGYHIHNLMIFDKKLYDEINKSGGQKSKLELVKELIE